MKKQYAYTSVITLSLLASAMVHAAPIAPDAGQTIRELQKQPGLSQPKAVTPLRVEDKAPPTGKASTATKITVKALHVSGNSIFKTGELEALVSDLVGGEHTLAELEAGAARITAYYRQRGYVVARAYLPAQDVKDGVVVIKVLEGLIGQKNINNKAKLSDTRANDYLQNVQSGDVVQAKSVDRALLLIADTPGVGGARATLQPGASVGTSDLIVELDPAKPYIANVELDNYGNRYTGEYRLGAVLAVNSPFNIGDQLIMRALTSDQNMRYARIAYQLPVGSDGLKVGAAYSDTPYELGKEFASLLAHGTASSTSLYATYPFIRSQLTNLSGTLTWENKKLADKTDAPVSSADKQVKLISFGLVGSRKDAMGGGGITSFDASLASGKLDMDAVSLAIDATSAQSNGSFTRLTYSINRQQRLTDKDTLSLALSGQQASKNLNSSEKFSLGGAYGVRAYPQGEGSGDQGWMINLEARHQLTDHLQGIVFYDAGSVKINRHHVFAAGENTRNISGAGVGLNAQYGWLQIKTAVAWRTNGGQPQSEPDTVNRNPRLWVQFSAQF